MGNLLTPAAHHHTVGGASCEVTSIRAMEVVRDGTVPFVWVDLEVSFADEDAGEVAGGDLELSLLGRFVCYGQRA